MSREFVVRIKHNDTDDRWTYTIDGISDMVYPYNVGGVDDFGHDQEGPWNESTSGFLDEICGCVSEEIYNVFESVNDSFHYFNGREID